MVRPQTSEARFEPHSSGPVVRRSWKLIRGRRRPLLTGLFGFPWRDSVVHAKCTDTQIAGPSQLFAGVRVDRWHPTVPSLDCTCGIYAGDEPSVRRGHTPRPRSAVVVTGFVRLTGRVLVSGTTYRAQQAEIVGPLTITLPPPPRVRRLGARWGVSQQIRRVTEDGDGWLFWYSEGRRGVSIGEWYRRVGGEIGHRYGVEVVGVLPTPAGLS